MGLTGHHHVWVDKGGRDVCQDCKFSITQEEIREGGEANKVEDWWTDGNRARARDLAVRAKCKRMGLPGS